MSSVDAPSQDNALRRIRSAGDIPERPARLHVRQASTSMASPIQLDASLIRSPLESASLVSSRLPSAPPNSPNVVPQAIVGYPGNAPMTPGHLRFGDVQGQGNRTSRPQHDGPLYRRVMAYFGLGRGASHTRKSQVSLIWNLSWGFSQIVIISTLLGLSGTHFKSPTHPQLTEWKACDRPLGVWACLWIIRVILASGLAYWEYVRDMARMRRPEGELGGGNPMPNSPVARNNPHSLSGENHDPPVGETTQPVILPNTQLYSRLTLLSSLVTLSWFLTAHILEYTSVNTCRHSSPHLWWLIFGILGIMYLMVLEVMLLGFVVLIVAPILFVFWNIFLICIGRHPMQNPGMIKPEIGKLPRSVVDRIPLVMYIPPPPEASPEKSVVTVPEPIYSYPPKPPTRRPQRSRFKFMNKIKPFGGKKGEAADSSTKDSGEKKKAEEGEEPESWEGHWERGEYPFVILEGNRAACAICLMDFDEPKRKTTGAVGGDAETTAVPVEPAQAATQDDGGVQEVPQVDIAEEENRDELKLTDAGEGAQPLRLLECGHVFHKTCLDPWLTDVSGRCPVCQRAVSLPGPTKKKRARTERRPNS